MNNENNIEYEKMIIDIPQNALAVSVVTIANIDYRQVMNTRTYDTKDIKNRKLTPEQFSSINTIPEEN